MISPECKSTAEDIPSAGGLWVPAREILSLVGMPNSTAGSSSCWCDEEALLSAQA